MPSVLLLIKAPLLAFSVPVVICILPAFPSPVSPTALLIPPERLLTVPSKKILLRALMTILPELPFPLVIPPISEVSFISKELVLIVTLPALPIAPSPTPKLIPLTWSGLAIRKLISPWTLIFTFPAFPSPPGS